MKRIYVSTLVSAAAGVAAIGLIAGCASNSPSNAAATSAGASGNSADSAYTRCLTEHGVTLPSGFGGGFGGRRSPGAGGFVRPTGSFVRPTGGFVRPSGGFGGGFGGGRFASADPSMAAALQACASDRPTNGFGGGGFGGGFGGGAGSSRLTAFRNCMSQQGEAVPTTRPTAVASGEARYLGGLSTADPKVAQALSVCKALIPTGAPSGAPTSG
jgi:hypothetical protein